MSSGGAGMGEGGGGGGRGGGWGRGGEERRGGTVILYRRQGRVVRKKAS